MTEESDQFSLVSLEKGSQKAASSYANMSRRAKGESDTTLNVNEEDAKEQLAPKPDPPPKKKKQEADDDKPKKKKKPKPAVSGDSMDQSIEDILAKLEEFNQSVQALLSNAAVAARNIAIVVVTPLLPLLNKLLKLLNIPLQFINLVARKVNEKMGNKKAAGSSSSGGKAVQSQDDEYEEEYEEEEAGAEDLDSASAANFSDMMELNIIFTDNMKKALYKKPAGAGMKLGAMEEDLIMSNAILAINECAEFTLELPDPTEGIYAGQRIYDIMSNATKQDVGVFLGFVKAYPGKYIGKEWKISETFATWLINNAPTSE